MPFLCLMEKFQKLVVVEMTTCFQTVRITVCDSHYKIPRTGNIIYYQHSFSEQHLYKPRRQDGMCLKVTQDKDGITKMLSSIGKVIAITGVPQWLKKPKRYTCLQKGEEGGSGKLPAIRLSPLSPSKVTEQVMTEAIWIVADIGWRVGLTPLSPATSHAMGTKPDIYSQGVSCTVYLLPWNLFSSISLKAQSFAIDCTGRTEQNFYIFIREKSHSSLAFSSKAVAFLSHSWRNKKPYLHSFSNNISHQA